MMGRKATLSRQDKTGMRDAWRRGMKRLNGQAGCVLLGLVSPFLLCCSRRGGPAFHQEGRDRHEQEAAAAAGQGKAKGDLTKEEDR